MAAPVTQTDIVNAAAALLGSSERITSMDGAGNLARHAGAVWDMTVRALFADHPWNALIERAPLNLSAAPAESGFAYRAALPVQCLRLLSVGDDDCDAFGDFAVEGGYLLTDGEGPAYARFVSSRYIDDCGRWPPHLVTAAGYALAQAMAEALTGAQGIDDKLTRKAEAALARAKRVDGLESQRARGRGVTFRSRWGAGMRNPFNRYAD